jgi:hypothetical protein
MSMNKGLESLIKPGMALHIVERNKYDVDEWNGRLLVWDAPRAGEEYILGVDTSEGVKKDRSVCEVIQKGNLYHPDIQVAEFACDFMDPVDFASVVSTIGKFYSDPDGSEAFCTIETNNPAGSSVLNTLRTKLDYTNLFIRKDYEKRENLYTTKLGWHTTRHNRGLIIARGIHALSYGDLIINSPYLLDEMADFESNHDIAQAKVKVGKGHDDRVMAMLVGYFGGHDDEWLSGDDIAEERRLREKAGQIQQKMAASDDRTAQKRPDWQSSAVSARKMNELAEDWLWDS